MIKSMTGFGKSECSVPNKKITVEIRSLNSKNLDLFTKIPGFYKEKEIEIRNRIASALVRGKCELSIYYEYTENSRATTINKSIVQGYFEQLKEVADALGIESNEVILQTAMRLPDTLNQAKEEIDQDEWNTILSCVDNSLKSIEEFRVQEGLMLEKDIINRINNILKYIPEVEKFESGRIEKVRQRLNDSLNDNFTEANIDNNRFEQEVIFYIEKLDITEEKVRLENHCNYFLETIKSGEPVGKKLGFISQEIGREINTLGSKANDSDIQKVVVLMKDELEKVKEQVLNIL